MNIPYKTYSKVVDGYIARLEIECERWSKHLSKKDEQIQNAQGEAAAQSAAVNDLRQRLASLQNLCESLNAELKLKIETIKKLKANVKARKS